MQERYSFIPMAAMEIMLICTIFVNGQEPGYAENQAILEIPDVRKSIWGLTIHHIANAMG